MGASAYSLAGFAGLVVLLLPALASAGHACDSLRHRQQMLNAQVLQLLAQTGTHIPAECVPQITAFNFPARDLNVREPRLARKAAYEMLRGLLGLFTSNLAQTGWAPAAQERLLSALHAHSKRIQECIGEGKTEPPSPEESLNKLILLRYFRGIRTFLRENSRGPCAGSIVQLGVRTCSTHLDMLINRLSHKGTGPASLSGEAGRDGRHRTTTSPGRTRHHSTPVASR